MDAGPEGVALGGDGGRQAGEGAPGGEGRGEEPGVEDGLARGVGGGGFEASEGGGEPGLEFRGAARLFGGIGVGQDGVGEGTADGADEEAIVGRRLELGIVQGATSELDGEISRASVVSGTGQDHHGLGREVFLGQDFGIREHREHFGLLFEERGEAVEGLSPRLVIRVKALGRGEFSLGIGDHSHLHEGQDEPHSALLHGRIEGAGAGEEILALVRSPDGEKARAPVREIAGIGAACLAERTQDRNGFAMAAEVAQDPPANSPG